MDEVVLRISIYTVCERTKMGVCQFAFCVRNTSVPCWDVRKLVLEDAEGY